MCTTGLGYTTIANFKPRNDRKHDDIRFEFKSTQSSGMIMYAKGYYKDYIYIGYKDSNVFMYHIELGTGTQALILYTLTSVCIISILFSIHSLRS